MDISRRNFLLGNAAIIGAASLASQSNKVYANPNPGPDPICPLGKEFIYNKEISDDFYGNTLNPNKWWDFNPSWNCHKLMLDNRKNVSVKNNKLQLSFSKIKHSEITEEMKIFNYHKFWTSYVKSIKRIKYGYIEASLKFMKSNIINSFWLYDPLSDKPSLKYTIRGGISEEINIVRSNIKNNKKITTSVNAYHTPYLEGVVDKSSIDLQDNFHEHSIDFYENKDFHKYGLLWTPDEICWYLDDKKIFSRNNDVFNRPLHICFNCKINHNIEANQKNLDLPQKFEIEYCRVFELNKKSEIIDFDYNSLQQIL